MRGKARCRMHGGGSTGPTTAEGIVRIRHARTIHGRYTKALLELRAVFAEEARLLRELRRLAMEEPDNP
jgi:hypothetical protein